MLEFVVHNWKLEPHPALLLIPELKALLEYEKKTAEGRAQGLKHLLYVWGMVSRLSPYDDLAPQSRDQNVRRCVYGDAKAGPTLETDEKAWYFIETAMFAYRYHNEGSEDRLMNELNHSVDMMADFLRNLREQGVTDALQLGPIIKAMAGIKGLLVNKREAEKVLKEGLEKSKTKNRAGAEPSPLERGLLNEVLKRGPRSAAEDLAREDADNDE